ncbi:hypothetical protein KBD81_06215, partial [Candidatus Woesebacteria bacterium]|nr:hypothetical protein [Candidatus Woesebacteria bacterium]
KQNVNVRTVLINASLRPKLNELSREYDFAIGLDVSPEQEIEGIADHYDLSLVPSIQIMTVSPGFQGSPFLPDMLMKIQQLREHDYSGEILIDGGINSTTIPLINSHKYMPDILCIGSFLTKAGDELESRINDLRTLEEKK